MGIIVAALGLAALVLYALFGEQLGGDAPSAVGAAGTRPASQTVAAMQPAAPVSAPAVMYAPPLPAAATPAAGTWAAEPAIDPPATPEPPKDTVPNFIPAQLTMYEVHWQGMDTRKLDSELRRKLGYPQGLEGILVTEVTFNAAASGLLAGDVIMAINDVPVTTLEQFQQQTRVVREQLQATLRALRKRELMQNGRHLMRQVIVVLKAQPYLGMGQGEAAPQILAGDVPPHPERGPCTNCHAIGSGFELPQDPDLIVLPPPPISQATARSGQAPHRDRGPCHACHVIR